MNLHFVSYALTYSLNQQHVGLFYMLVFLCALLFYCSFIILIIMHGVLLLEFGTHMVIKFFFQVVNSRVYTICSFSII